MYKVVASWIKTVDFRPYFLALNRNNSSHTIIQFFPFLFLVSKVVKRKTRGRISLKLKTTGFKLRKCTLVFPLLTHTCQYQAFIKPQ